MADETNDNSETSEDEVRDKESLDEVIDELEEKLEDLDARRQDLEQKIKLKRARVDEINETIENLEDIEETIDQPSE